MAEVKRSLARKRIMALSEKNVEISIYCDFRQVMARVKNQFDFRHLARVGNVEK